MFVNIYANKKKENFHSLRRHYLNNSGLSPLTIGLALHYWRFKGCGKELDIKLYLLMTQHKCPLLQALPPKGKTTQLRTSTFYLLMLARIALENGATGVINFQVTPRFCKNCSQFKKKYLASIKSQKLLILDKQAI